MGKRPVFQQGRKSAAKKWKTYQSRLQKKDDAYRAVRRLPGYILLLAILLLAIHSVFRLLDRSLEVPFKQYSLIFPDKIKAVDKRARQRILRWMPPDRIDSAETMLNTGGKTYTIEWSIDPDLQQYVTDHVDQKNSLYFGLVAMEPDTGRLICMVSFDRSGACQNTCSIADFPAASLFKIVTAAAAVEKNSYNCNTPVEFNGNKYTLYKRQLSDQINKYTSTMTFEESFADSVNPVFGKIGYHVLGKSTLETYAAAFGFNREFDFEIPMAASQMAVDENPYNWAEVASGFNHRTRISPLHGALIISAILNEGAFVAPTVIDRVTTAGGRMLYEQQPEFCFQAVENCTAATLKELLQATVISGTAARSFKPLKSDKIWSKLIIGGKTGSINNNMRHLKYDWFAGFAEDKNGVRKIALCTLVVHQDYIGTRSAQYARMVIERYFKTNDDETPQT